MNSLKQSSMNIDYSSLRSQIKSLDLNENISFTFSVHTSLSDTESQLIKSLLESESIYLQNIKTLMSTTFRYLDKDVKSTFRIHIISKEEVRQLLLLFPRIYDLHVKLYNSTQDETEIFGKILYEFLSQSELFDVYALYVTRTSYYLKTCKLIVSKSDKQNNVLNCLEDTILSPVYRFSQLSKFISKLYKNTQSKDSDKINLFKAMLISKSFTLRLDRLKWYSDCKDLSDTFIWLRKFKLGFSSKIILSSNLIFDLNTTFDSNEKVIKLSYRMIIFDKNLVMMPRDVDLSDLSTTLVICFSLDKINVEKLTLSKFNKIDIYEHQEKNQMIDRDGLKKFNEIYLAINSPSCMDQVIKKYGDLQNDFRILADASETVKQLTFHYKEVDEMELETSLKDLEKELKAKELELDALMSSVLILNYKVSDTESERKFILFDSTKKANELRLIISRAIYLADKQETADWVYFSAGRNFQRLEKYELPHVLPPFVPKTDIIKPVESIIMRCQPVVMVVGMTFCSCLLISLANGLIIIMNFDSKDWCMLDHFQVNSECPLECMCYYTAVDRDAEDVVNSEIWMAYGNHAYIFNLLNNRYSQVQETLNFKTDIKSLCTVENLIFVALKSNFIVICVKDPQSFWRLEKEISVEMIEQRTDRIAEVIYGNNLVYVICEKGIVIYENFDGENLALLNEFAAERSIITASLVCNGVLVSFEKLTSIFLYDKLMHNTLQTISIPLDILDLPPIGQVVSIYANQRYVWLGTENGFIICIPAMDSSYCIDSNIPLYVSSRIASGPISQLIPLQQCSPIIMKTHSKKNSNENCPSGASNNSSIKKCMKRWNSCPGKVNCENVRISENDALCKKCLHNAFYQSKLDTQNLLVALGSGTRQFEVKSVNSHNQYKFETSNDGLSSIFTFVE